MEVPTGWVALSPETYDAFQGAYVALADVLQEARAYVYGVANDNGPGAQPWRKETAQGVLERIDSALAMKANLKKEV